MPTKMEDDGIGLVLARATELRLKISNCIHKATSRLDPPSNGHLAAEEADGNQDSSFRSRIEMNDTEDEENEDEEERLLNICDALESLETQLSSLQTLQQQQWYEKEVALAEIENSRKMLLDKLKEYEGKELEVIHEASTFAAETVEDNNDLLLPPYPSRPPYSMCLGNGYVSQTPPTHKPVRNGLISIEPIPETDKTHNESEKNLVQTDSKESRRGLGFFVSSAAKTVLTLVGLVSILSSSGFGPNFVKRGTHFNVLGMLQRSETEKERSTIQCPPGKMEVVENGETRCIVKERVQVPFSAVTATPDINYGCG
ncbi:plastid division protein PDV2-like [Quillaja saponaria]|uniref:Plastid division protein PDV2-like n=1 Tax=Quillaja saponaria TaxID=32244 RepID=A0AAD7KW11_QUISA|nr:plastid division protein PDV2-like [Quillaja saponaria]